MVLSPDQHDAVFRKMLTDLLFPKSLWDKPEMPAALSTFSAMDPDAAEFAVQIFPEIHFANIVRNGIEVVASRSVHRVLGQHSFEEQCLAWAAAVDMVHWGRERHDFSVIRHEDLLEEESCRAAVDQLLNRAGLASSQAVADHFLTQRRNQTSMELESEEEAADLSLRHKRWQAWDRRAAKPV